MYCHDLRLFKNSGESYAISCEDGVDGVMMITPHELKLDEQIMAELVAVLRTWALAEKLTCRIYTASDRHEAFPATQGPACE